MSPELGLALLVTLLWGPTAIWLVYRVVRIRRDPRAERAEAMRLAERGSRPEPDEIRALVDEAGFWVCGACRSLNRPEDRRCYSCRATTDGVAKEMPAEPALAPMVAVMADDIARIPTAVPVMDAAAAIVAPAEPVGACPLLGLRHDPSTHYDFPHPENVCHAIPRGGRASAALRRLVPPIAGRRRPQVVAPWYQGSRCLTPAHLQCERYLRTDIVTPPVLEPPRALPVALTSSVAHERAPSTARPKRRPARAPEAPADQEREAAAPIAARATAGRRRGERRQREAVTERTPESPAAATLTTDPPQDGPSDQGTTGRDRAPTVLSSAPEGD